MGDAASLSRAGPRPKRSFPELFAVGGEASGADGNDTRLGGIPGDVVTRMAGDVVDAGVAEGVPPAAGPAAGRPLLPAADARATGGVDDDAGTPAAGRETARVGGWQPAKPRKAAVTSEMKPTVAGPVRASFAVTSRSRLIEISGHSLRGCPREASTGCPIG